MCITWYSLYSNIPLVTESRFEGAIFDWENRQGKTLDPCSPSLLSETELYLPLLLKIGLKIWPRILCVTCSRTVKERVISFQIKISQSTLSLASVWVMKKTGQKIINWIHCTASLKHNGNLYTILIYWNKCFWNSMYMLEIPDQGSS